MVDLRFLGWDAPALPRAARLLMDAAEHDLPREAPSRGTGGGSTPTSNGGPRGVAGEVGMEGMVVVVPGARAGRRLTELLVFEAEDRGRALRPPRIITAGALPELLISPGFGRRLADPPVIRRAWARALQELPGALLRRILPHPPDRSMASAWDGLARVLLQIHREMAGEGLRFPAALASCRKDELLFDDGERWEALVRVQDRAARILEDAGLEDRESRRLRALDVMDSEDPFLPPDHLWIVGVPELPRSVRRMIEWVHARGTRITALVQAPEERSEGFDSFGCLRVAVWSDATLPVEDADLRVRDRPADQADEVIRFLAMDPVVRRPEEIAIGVPDDDLVPYLEDRFSEVAVPVRYAAGTPIARTPAFRLLEAGSRLLSERSFPALAALLRHPDLRDWLLRKGGRRTPALRDVGRWISLSDRYFTRHLPGSVAEPLPGAGEDREQMEIVRALVFGPAFLGRLEGRPRPLSQWMQPVLDLLVEVYGEAPLSRGLSRERVTIESCERIRASAAAVARMPAALDDACTGAEALRLLLSLIGHDAVPPEPDQAAVELLGWLELPLDDAPVVVVTGVNEPHLPASVTADPFLPGGLRARLGLPDTEARYARDLFHLTALLQDRERVLLVSGRRNASGDPLRPSRLLFATMGEAAAHRVLEFVRGKTSRGVSPTGGTFGGSAPSPAGGAGDPDADAFRLPSHPELLLPDPPDSLRVTDFRGLLADPYRFALERFWRLAHEADDARELDPLEFGSLAHHALHLFGVREIERGEGAPLPSAAAFELELGGILDDVVAERFGRRPLPAVRIQVEQLRFRFAAFARQHHDWRREGWTVAAVEAEGEAPGVPFPVDDDPFFLRGRIDRIDRHRDGGWALLDYKTSEEGRDPDQVHRRGPKDAREWVDLQLPLYRHLLPHIRRDCGDDPQVLLGYLVLPRMADGTGVRAAVWTAEELAGADEAARRVVRALRTGRFVFEEDGARARADDPMAALLGRGILGGALPRTDRSGPDEVA